MLPAPNTPNQLLEHFRLFLLEPRGSRNKTLSHVTIKNYLSDLNRFFSWLSTQPDFVPQNPLLQQITSAKINLYLLHLQHRSPHSTLNRHTASLRSFSTFLKLKYQIELSPITPTSTSPSSSASISIPNLLSQFKNYLKQQKKSHSTIKNYLSDLNHFFIWVANHLPQNQTSLPNIITSTNLKAYQNYLKLTQTSSSVIKRRTSSLKTFARFATSTNLLSHNPFSSPPYIKKIAPLAWFKISPQPSETLPPRDITTQSPKASKKLPVAQIAIIIGLLLLIIGIGTSFYTLNQDLRSKAKTSPSTNINNLTNIISPDDTQTLQGYIATSPATINTIPLINNDGDLIIAANSPTIESTSGTFGLKGEAITISTAPTSDGDITLSPDGTGQLLAIGGTTTTDFLRVTNANLTSGTLISGYIGNNTATGNLLTLSSGSSETDRLTITAGGQTTINAQGKGDAALVVNNLDSSNIFAASASGVNKFIITNTGKVGIGTVSPSSTLEIDGTLTSSGGVVDLNVSSSYNATNINTGTSTGALSLGGGSGTVAVDSTTWDISTAGVASGLTGFTSSGTITLSGLTASRAIFTDASKNLVSTGASADLLASLSDETGTGVAVFNASPTFTTNITVPLVIGGTDTTSDLSLKTTSGVGTTGADMHFLVGNDGGTEAMTILNSGYVGINTVAPEEILTTVGNIQLGITDGTRYIYFDNGTATNAGLKYDSSTDKMQYSHDGSTWDDIGSGSPSYWTLADGSLYPVNATLDLFVGGTSTASAKFAFINVNSGTPTLSLANQASDIAIKDNTASALRIVEGSNVYLGITTTDNQEAFTLDMPVGGGTSQTANLFTSNIAKTIYLGSGTAIDTINIGTGGTGADDVNIGDALADVDITGASQIVAGTSNTLTITANAASTWSSSTGALVISGDDGLTLTAANTAGITMNSTAGTFLVTATGQIVDIDGTTLDVDTSGAIDLLAASTFSLDGTGASNVSATSGNLTLSTLTTGNLILNSVAEVDLDGTTVNIDGSVAMNIGTTADVPFDMDTSTLDIDSSGAIDILSTSTFSLDGTGASNVSATSGNLTLSTLTTGNLILTPADDLVFTGFDCSGNTNGGALTADASGVITCSDDNYDPSYWTLADGSLYPVNATLDLFVGGTSTASAKFAFINVNDGTPTASISGSTANVATYLTGEGNLATTNMASLTLGGSTTGPIQLSPKGTDGLYIDGTGKVGIGTTGPEQKLEISGGSKPTVRIMRSYVDGGYGVSLSSGWDATVYDYFAIGIGSDGDPLSAEKVRITNSGNVGIGTENPGYKLEVAGTSQFDDTAYFANGTTYYVDSSGNAKFNDLIIADTGNPGITIGNGSTGFLKIGSSTIFDNNETYLSFDPDTDGNAEVVFTNAGNVGIGTTGPGARLDVRVADVGGDEYSEQFRLYDTSSVAANIGAIINLGGTYTGTTVTEWAGIGSGKDNAVDGEYGGYLTLSSRAHGGALAEQVRIDSSGNVGIGTIAPDTKLDVEGVDGTTSYIVARLNGGTSGYGSQLQFTDGTNYNFAIGTNNDTTGDFTFNAGRYPGTAGTEVMRIKQTGNVGIGTTDPGGANLMVSGGTGDGAGGGNSDLWIGESLTHNLVLAWKDAATDYAVIETYAGSGNLALQTNGGNVGIGTNSPSSLLSLASTSTSTSFTGFDLDWSPGSAITTTGDLFSINIGSNGTADNLFAVYDNSSDVFTVGQTKIESAVPHEFSAAGDVGMAYDLIFTNQTASFIKSYASLTLESGESFESNNLVLRTYNSGDIILDTGAYLGVGTSNPQKPFHFDSGNTNNAIILNSMASNADANTALETAGAYNISFGVWSTGFYQYYTDSSNVARYIATTGTAIDLAEWYKVGPNSLNPQGNSLLQKGDLLCADPNEKEKVISCSTSYNSHIIGIVSTLSYTTMGMNDLDDDHHDATEVALTGRVPLKIVVPPNTQINNGDHITSSSIPAFGQKIQKVGTTVGTAMESTSHWNSNTCPSINSPEEAIWPEDNGTNQQSPCFKLPDDSYIGKVMVFVNVSWHDPNIYFTDTGDLNITQNQDPQDQDKYQITDTTNEIIENISVFSSSLIANLKAGSIVTQEIVTESLTIEGISLSDYIAQVVTDLLPQTALISPLGKFDSLTANTATISGTLYAQNIENDQINYLDEQLEELTQELNTLSTDYATASGILADIQARYSSYDSLINPQDIPDPLNTSSLDTSNATVSGDIALGTNGSLILDDLLVNNTLIASSLSSNLDDTLYIQPLANASLNLLAGLMTLSPDGKVTVNGDLWVTGSIMAQNLEALRSTIYDLTTNTATIAGQLTLGQPATSSSGFGQLLAIFDEQGQQVASINASGSAQFNSLTTQNLIIAAASASPSGDINTLSSSNATAGTAILPAGETQIVIPNTNITPTTLIYLTPLSDTNNQVLYVLSKTDTEFTVATNQPIITDIEFNYWLIQTLPLEEPSDTENTN